MNSLTFRPARGAEDTDALLAVHAACTIADGVHSRSTLEYRPNADWYRKLLNSSDTENWIIAEADGVVVGYGHTLFDWPEESGTHVYLHLGWVIPERRGGGIGTELLAHLEARCRQRALAEGKLNSAEFGANASDTESAARELLEASGYFVVYTILAMERATDQPVPDAPLPKGYTLRPVEPDHYRAIWQCIGDAYYEEGISGRFRQPATESDYQRYFFSDRADPTLWFIAWEGSRIAGQVLCRIDDGYATVYEVSVGSAHRRKGLAQALLASALRTLQERQVALVMVHTRQEFSTQAWRLYEKMGFQTTKRFPRWRRPF